MNGWIKLHRSLLDNDIWRSDKTAFNVFLTLLLLCDTKKGQWSGGRYQLAEYCGFKDGAVYKALQRLAQAKMVTLSSNSRFTTISICNWKEYQFVGNSSSNSKVTLNKNNINIYNSGYSSPSTVSAGTSDNRGQHSPAKERVKQLIQKGGIKALKN